jgi:hypothetical protein
MKDNTNIIVIVAAYSPSIALRDEINTMKLPVITDNRGAERTPLSIDVGNGT